MNTRFDPKSAPAQRASQTGAPVQETANAARQGSSGRPVLVVLICALALVAVAWAGAEWWGESTDAPAEQTATPPAGDNAPRDPANAPAGAPASTNVPTTTDNRPTGNP